MEERAFGSSFDGLCVNSAQSEKSTQVTRLDSRFLWHGNRRPHLPTVHYGPTAKQFLPNGIRLGKRRSLWAYDVGRCHVVRLPNADVDVLRKAKERHVAPQFLLDRSSQFARCRVDRDLYWNGFGNSQLRPVSEYGYGNATRSSDQHVIGSRTGPGTRSDNAGR